MNLALGIEASTAEAPSKRWLGLLTCYDSLRPTQGEIKEDFIYSLSIHPLNNLGTGPGWDQLSPSEGRMKASGTKQHRT